jgi:hypothetical protein
MQDNKSFFTKPNRRKEITHIRAYPNEKMKLNELCLKASFVEGKPVRVPELLRRTLNIPNISNILIQDAELKKRLKK